MFGIGKKAVPKPLEKGVARVPVVMQMEALECGAASLTMIMHYYRKFIPLEQARVDCGVSMNGSSAASILAAARSISSSFRPWTATALHTAGQALLFVPVLSETDIDHSREMIGKRKIRRNAESLRCRRCHGQFHGREQPSGEQSAEQL